MVDARDLKSLGACPCTSSILVPGTSKINRLGDIKDRINQVRKISCKHIVSGGAMKKLYYKCSHCGGEHPFDKTDLPAGFISPDDLNENRINLLAVDCPVCNQSDIFTLEDVKKALAIPEPPKSKWEWYWKG